MWDLHRSISTVLGARATKKATWYVSLWCVENQLQDTLGEFTRSQNGLLVPLQVQWKNHRHVYTHKLPTETRVYTCESVENILLKSSGTFFLGWVESIPVVPFTPNVKRSKARLAIIVTLTLSVTVPETPVPLCVNTTLARRSSYCPTNCPNF